MSAPELRNLAMPLLTDNAAREVALTRWALPESLHLPIAAVDENAIAAYT
jgi:hypothetical protein